MRFFRQFRVAPGKMMHRFFRVFRVFRGLFFVRSQMENGTIASGLIDKIDPQRNADRRRFSDPGRCIKTPLSFASLRLCVTLFSRDLV
jgi:hypothetical protein